MKVARLPANHVMDSVLLSFLVEGRDYFVFRKKFNEADPLRVLMNSPRRRGRLASNPGPRTRVCHLWVVILLFGEFGKLNG
jgi:hypothetical protein